MSRVDTQIEWPQGVKRTKPRERVLAVLAQADTPLSPMDIHARAQDQTDPIWLSTVYRVLETFAQKGLIVKTVVMDSGMAVYALNRHEHTHYAVCMGCHKIVGMENCPMEAFIPNLGDSGFHVLGHKIEMYGYCRDCDRKKRE